MLISHEHQFIFIHVPKTGGQSIKASLLPYSHNPRRLLVNRLLGLAGIRVNRLIGPITWRRFRVHDPAATVKRVLPAEVFRSYFRFAFVRNPWDWLVSHYHFMLQRPDHRRHHRVKRLSGLADYVRWQAARPNHDQAHMITGADGELLVDFVGRFESLQADFHHVARRLNLPIDLPRLNVSHHKDYRSYYDDATAELVAEQWSTDVRLFGYTFDGAAPVRRAA